MLKHWSGWAEEDELGRGKKGGGGRRKEGDRKKIKEERKKGGGKKAFSNAFWVSSARDETTNQSGMALIGYAKWFGGREGYLKINHQQNKYILILLQVMAGPPLMEQVMATCDWITWLGADSPHSIVVTTPPSAAVLVVVIPSLMRWTEHLPRTPAVEGERWNLVLSHVRKQAKDILQTCQLPLIAWVW